MRYLTTYLDDEINFKSGNRGSIIRLKASDDHTVVNFTTEDKLVVKSKMQTRILIQFLWRPTGKSSN